MDKAIINQYLGIEINRVALEGSEKQISWAYDIRKATLTTYLNRLSHKSVPDADYSRGIAALRVIFAAQTSAKWWIDNRNTIGAALNPAFQAALAEIA